MKYFREHTGYTKSMSLKYEPASGQAMNYFWEHTGYVEIVET